jgi:hypothetical protein
MKCSRNTITEKSAVCEELSTKLRFGRLFDKSTLKKTIWSAFLLLLFFAASSDIAYAHPGIADIFGIDRHDLGVAFAIFGLAFSLSLYIIVGLRQSSRAETVREYFFYDKKVGPGQYFDTTVGYSFQVVVTIFFVYWGFRYGIGTTIYAIMWLIGFLLFQLCAKQLLEFATSQETLHSFLAKKYGASLAIRRLTAICTILGLLGALFVEVNYTTDLITNLSLTPLSTAGWSLIFFAFVFITWMYIQYGGFKSAAITASVQLPVTYASLAIVLSYLIWLSFSAGFYTHAFTIGIIIAGLWAIIFLARSSISNIVAVRDLATIVSIAAFFFSLLVTGLCWYAYGISGGRPDMISDLPDSFTWAAFKAQDNLVFVGFLILNLCWQFFDMSAWQRIAALDFGASSEPEERIRYLKSVIGETKWESPVTWMFGIIIGIALRHSGLFSKGGEALTASPFNIVIAGRAARTSTHDRHSRIQCLEAVLL